MRIKTQITCKIQPFTFGVKVLQDLPTLSPLPPVTFPPTAAPLPGLNLPPLGAQALSGGRELTVVVKWWFLWEKWWMVFVLNSNMKVCFKLVTKKYSCICCISKKQDDFELDGLGR